MAKKLAVVVSRGRAEPSSRQKTHQDLADSLDGWQGVEVVTLPHLYDLAPDGPGMQHLRSVAGDMVVLSRLYPRAAFWVLDANGIRGRMGPVSPAQEDPETVPEDTPQPAAELPDRTIWCLDLREYDQLAPMLEEIERFAVQATGGPVVSLGGDRPATGNGRTHLEEDTRYRWYPVIDYSRCRNCLECLNFCLFGVFGLDESQRLLVEQPDACRNGCPACSRVCPSHAIIFPQHNSPAIAGDPEASVEGFNLDLVQLLGTTGAAELAAAERERALQQRAKADGPGPNQPGQEDDLDRLVDDLDAMDL
jgi:NAD-dependent dihydropyrimidine dehydrogenase PreA subunit